MGYRSAWMRHEGRGSRHMEAVLYALDKEIAASSPVRMLMIGVENGGSLEVWQECLPEGSDVLAVDIDPLAGELGLPVVVGDARDRDWFRRSFRGEWFNAVINTTPDPLSHLWPWLLPGGVWAWEGYDTEAATDLVAAVNGSEGAWLPSEEIMRVSCWPDVLFVEKRSPQVVPYLELMVGQVFDVVPEDALYESGVKRIVME